MDFISTLPQMFSTAFTQMLAIISYQTRLEGIIDLTLLVVFGVVIAVIARRLIRKALDANPNSDSDTEGCCWMLTAVLVFCYTLPIIL